MGKSWKEAIVRLDYKPKSPAELIGNLFDLPTLPVNEDMRENMRKIMRMTGGRPITANDFAKLADDVIYNYLPIVVSLEMARSEIMTIWLREAMPNSWWQRVVFWYKLWRKVNG